MARRLTNPQKSMISQIARAGEMFARMAMDHEDELYGKFCIETTFAKTDALAGKVLIANAAVPAGRKLYIDSIAVKVNGATAWTDTTATVLRFQDLNGTPVVFASIAKAGLGANEYVLTADTDVSLGAGFWSGGTVAKGLTLKGDAAFANGSDLIVRVVGHMI